MPAALEQNVGRKFTLSRHPIVLGVLKNILHLRRDQLGILTENLGPVQIREAIGELLRSAHILDPQKRVLVFGVANAIGLQLAREPFVPH